MAVRARRAQRRVQLLGLVFEAHRLLYHSTLGLRVIKKKKKLQLRLRVFRHVNTRKFVIYLTLSSHIRHSLHTISHALHTQRVRLLQQGYLGHKKAPPSRRTLK